MLGKQLIGSDTLPPKTQETVLKIWEGRVDRVLMAGGRMWGAKVRDENKTQGEAKLPGELPKATWSWHPNPLCTPFLSGLPLSMSGTLPVDVLEVQAFWSSAL